MTAATEIWCAVFFALGYALAVSHFIIAAGRAKGPHERVRRPGPPRVQVVRRSARRVVRRWVRRWARKRVE